MVRFAAGMLLGTLPVGWLGTLPPFACVPLLLVLSAALARPAYRRLFSAGCTLGLALALSAALAATEDGLDPALEGETLLIHGTVEDLPEVQGRRTRFLFSIEEARREGLRVTVPSRVRLNWYGPDRPDLRPGVRATLRVRLQRARGFANPGTFDYALWLLREGIGATGYVRRAVDVSPPAGLEALSLAGLRHALRAHLHTELPDGSSGAILLALALGERGDIGAGDWDVLRATGTTHLVAISGLHIGIVAFLGFRLGALLWRLAGRAASTGPRPVFQAWVALACAAGYAALAGFSLPTMRALIMLAVGLATIVLRRRARALEGVATALLVVLLYDPLAPLGPSFWLSFGAVTAILVLLAGRIAPPGRIQRWLGLQFGICLALTPLLFGFFGEASIVAPLANTIAIPWISFLVVPPTLAATAIVTVWPEMAGMVFAMTAAILEPLWSLLVMLADWSLAEWHLARPPVALLMLALAGCGLVIAPRGVPGRWAGVLAVLPMLLWTPARPSPGGVWVDLLDVGQGLAAVVRTSEHTLVYDTGARFSRSFDAGSAVVVPFLRAEGVEHVDALVLSHLDNDHAGGRAAVIKQLRPAAIWSSAPLQLEQPADLCARGTRWTWDDVRFRFLHPDPDDALTGNDASCVLRVDAPGGSVLLPGDIEAAAERRLLARGEDLAADVVVAPHHGSLTSSSPAFVRAVDADQVLYPVGYNNRWDFPRPEVMARWAPAVGLGTDCAGAIAVRVDPERGVGRATGWRQRAPRFWQAGCARIGKSGTMRAVRPGGPPAVSGG